VHHETTTILRIAIQNNYGDSREIAEIIGVVKVTNELLFRVAFSALWVIFFASVIWVGYSTKGSADRQTTPHANRLRIAAAALAIIYFAGALAYAVFPSWVMFLSILLPDWLRLVMVGAAVLGILLVSWGYRALGKNWAPSVSGVRKDTVLVTNGLYGFVRHPIYLGAFIFLVALSLVAANLVILLPTLALLALLYASIDEEEAMLAARFGDEYREYMKRTPRFIPKSIHSHSMEQRK
jgi:protein-S-isoprenylcysteine O-methyltransferase Ste14